MKPQVTIGMPLYQAERYLREAVDSALAQSFEAFTVLLCDNASTDSTPSVSREYAARDPRVRFIPSSFNRGAAWNFNRSFELCETPYFMWLAHDDRLRPTFLEKATSVLNADPTVALCYGKTEFIDADGESLGPYDDGLHLNQTDPSERFRAHLRRYQGPSYCNPVYGLYRTPALARTPVMGAYPSSDIVLLGATALNGRILEIPEILFERREHPRRSLKAHPSMQERAEWFAPGSGEQPQYPTWRFLKEYARSIELAPLSPRERLMCLRALLAAYALPNQKELWVETRCLLGRLKRQVLDGLDRAKT